MDDEVSLLRLWLVVRRRWAWLFAGFFVGLAGAVTYAASVVPTYESRATIQIGKVRDGGLLEDPESLVLQLVDEYGTPPEEGRPYLRQAIKIAGQSPILRLVAAGGTPDETKDFLADVVRRLVERHEEIYQGAMEPVRQRLVTLDGHVALLTAQVAEFHRLIARLQNSYPAQASLVAIERGELYAKLSDLERDRVVLQQLTTKPYSSPSEVIAGGDFSASPNAPRMLVWLVMGIIFGLMLGLFAVFFREFVARVQLAIKSDKRKAETSGN